MESPYIKFMRFFAIKPEPNQQELDAFKRTQKVCAYIKHVPGIESVCVCNSMSMYASKPTSDIDLFIIAKHNFLWLVRCTTLFILTVMNVRARGKNTTNRFCCSFFLSSDALDLDFMAQKEDIYLWHWVYFLKPIFNREQAYERFLQANKLPLGNKMLSAIQIKLGYTETIEPIHGDAEWKRFLISDISEQTIYFS